MEYSQTDQNVIRCLWCCKWQTYIRDNLVYIPLISVEYFLCCALWLLHWSATRVCSQPPLFSQMTQFVVFLLFSFFPPSDVGASEADLYLPWRQAEQGKRQTCRQMRIKGIAPWLHCIRVGDDRIRLAENGTDMAELERNEKQTRNELRWIEAEQGWQK